MKKKTGIAISLEKNRRWAHCPKRKRRKKAQCLPGAVPTADLSCLNPWGRFYMVSGCCSGPSSGAFHSISCTPTTPLDWFPFVFYLWSCWLQALSSRRSDGGSKREERAFPMRSTVGSGIAAHRMVSGLRSLTGCELQVVRICSFSCCCLSSLQACAFCSLLIFSREWDLP